VLHTQLAEQQQLRQAAEQGCTAAQAEVLAARQAAAEHQGEAKAAVMEAEQRAAAAAKAVGRADTAAAVAAAQRQQAEQTSDQFQRRLHEVQTQLNMQQQQERALREHIAKARTCMLIMSVQLSDTHLHLQAKWCTDRWALDTNRSSVQAESDIVNVQSRAEARLAKCRDEAASARQQCEEAAAQKLATAEAAIAELVQQGQQAADEADSMRKNLRQVEGRAAAAAEEHEVRDRVLLCDQGNLWLLAAADYMYDNLTEQCVLCRLSSRRV
jgi:hypothetical protein